MRQLLFCVGCLLGVIACGQTADRDDTGESIGTGQFALVDSVSVLGFENASGWTSSQGIKNSSSIHSQGTASLALSNFTYTDVISTPLSTLSGVNSTLNLDVRLPVAVAWGSIQLFVSIPSQNVYQQALALVSLVGLAPGSFSTLTFNVPAAFQQKLSASYADLTFRIAVNAPQTSQALLLDNLRFPTQSIQARTLELEVDSADDAITAFVDGLRRDTWRINDPRLGTRVDISNWFASGTHSLRLIGSNSGGPVNYAFRVWADGVLAYDGQCPADVCDGTDKDQDVLFDKTLSFSTPTHLPAQSVQVTSATPGKIYINNAFTGLTTTGTSSPVTFSLPQTSYKIGLGISSDAAPSYTGEYHEQSVVVGSSAVSVNLSSAPKLGFADATSVVVVPIRHTVYDPTGQTGDLTDEDISSFQAQVAATKTQWLEPFSYGLNTWNVTYHAAVDSVPAHVTTANHGPDTDTFLCATGLTALRQNYELVVFLWNGYDDTGAELPVDFSAYGGGGQVWMNTFWTRRTDWPHTGPNPALLHEVLHSYEGYNTGALGFYNGVSQLHGAEQHGYYGNAGGELDFALWQRAYIRGQVGELLTMQSSVNWPSPVSNPDLWVGVFDTIRNGYNPGPGSVTCPSPNTFSRAAATFSGGATSYDEAVRCPRQ